MKQILLLAVMLALVASSSANPAGTRAIGLAGVSANPVEVEGVTIERQRLARLHPGYQFRRESLSSLSVIKNVRDAAFPTGTLTCTRPGKTCTVEFGGDTAKCSSGATSWVFAEACLLPEQAPEKALRIWAQQ